MDDKILFLYAQGMTTREIVAAFKDRYDADVSATLISRVTDAVIEQVVAKIGLMNLVYNMRHLVQIDKLRTSGV